jgi:LCP family protein required for cell wall assembly
MEKKEINNLRNSRQLNKKIKKKKRRKIIWFILALILLAMTLLITDVLRRANSTFKEMFEPIGEDVADIRREEGLPELNLGEDPFSVLILGLDEGRSDAMMVATVNPNEGTTYLLSIARDTMVTIPGYGTTRINHAFAYGGIDLAINTVQEFLNVPIDYHASLAMDEFHTLVDAFGGVRVYNDTVAFSMGGYDFPLGFIDLTGASAYYYARMRMNDPRGDFGRQERQREILQAMADELAGVTLITRYQQILDSVGEHMRTNVTLNEMMSISIRYNQALRKITNFDLDAPGQMINGMYLIPIPEQQRLEMSHRLRNHLELQ